MFASFKNNWPLLFGKAFGDNAQNLSVAKRYWFNSAKLWEFTEQQILAAVQNAVDQAEYMPTTVGQLLKYAPTTTAMLGVKSPDAAWEEACMHSHEVLSHKWSHRVVYQAGRHTGWHQIKTASGEQAVARLRHRFAQHYQEIVSKLSSGASLQGDAAAALDDHSQNSVEEKAIQYGKCLSERAVSKLGLPQKMTGSDALSRLKSSL